MGDIVKKDESATQAAGDRMLALIRTKYPQYHPILAIAELAHHADADLKMQLECHKTLVRYVTPELKSVEVKAEITEHRRVIVSMFEDGELKPADMPATPIQATKPDPLWERMVDVEDAEVVQDAA